MELVRLGDLDARVVGGGEELVVVLLHGFGAPGDDLVSLAHPFASPRTRFVFPVAPISFDANDSRDGSGVPSRQEGSRAWWMIDLMRIQTRLFAGQVEALKNDVPEGLEPARAQLESLLDAVQARYQIAGSRMVLGGFSQGAMLALHTALVSDRTLAGLVLFSGTIICAEQWRQRFAARNAIPIFQSHGRNDPLLPFSFADELRAMLSSAGFHHTWIPFSGGHEIPFEVVTGAKSFLGRLL